MNEEQQLVQKVSPPLDGELVALLFSEFVDMERNFVLGNWGPTTLDGGQFCEIAAQIIYHIDSGNLNRRKALDSCMKYVEDGDNTNTHFFPDKQASRHLCRAIRTVYKFRSQRGAIHIDPEYTANEMDSTLVVGLSRWIISEILRIFCSEDRNEIAEAIREITCYKVPSVLVMDGNHLVLRTDCTVAEEILLLLHNVGGAGMTRQMIGKSVPKALAAVSKAIKKLEIAREIFHKTNGHYVLTPKGAKFVSEKLSEKLTLSD